MAEEKKEGFLSNVGTHVQDFYGKVLAKTEDVKSSACSFDIKAVPKHVRDTLQMVHVDITSKFYGCGIVAPERLTGLNILDIGCGSGQDTYILSKLVGETGHVTGIDFTQELVDTATKYIDHHTKVFGFSKPNVEFLRGDIQDLKACGIEDNKYDIVTSNGVINLVPDKRAVLQEAKRVLKEGGELYFFDVYVDRELPPKVRQDKELWGECIAGALYWKDLAKLAKEVGLSSPRLLNSKPMIIDDKYRERVGEAQFVTATYRLFKLPAKMSPAKCIKYKGTIHGYPGEVALDHYTVFHKGVGVQVSGETATILQNSRFKEEFEYCDQDDALNAADPILLAHAHTATCRGK